MVAFLPKFGLVPPVIRTEMFGRTRPDVASVTVPLMVKVEGVGVGFGVSAKFCVVLALWSGSPNRPDSRWQCPP